MPVSTTSSTNSIPSSGADSGRGPTNGSSATINKDDVYRIPEFQRHDYYRSWPTILQVLTIGLVLVPLKSTLIVIIVIANWLVQMGFELALRRGSVSAYVQMPEWRRRLNNRCTRLVSRALLFLSGFFRIRRHNITYQQLRELRAEHTADYNPHDSVIQETEQRWLLRGIDPFVIVSNHISNFDAGIIACDLSPFSIISKASLQRVPIISSWAKVYEYLFYSGVRGGEIIEAIRERSKRYYTFYDQNLMHREESDVLPPRLLIFAEGTTSNGRSLLRFHKGAFCTEMPVQPVVLRYRWWKFNPSICNRVNWILWWIAAQAQLYQVAEAIHLPPYVPTEAERRDFELYAENVRRVMAAACNLIHNEDNDPMRLELSDWFFSRRKRGEAASQV